jgi:Trk K+ transport system NAD-binding subunit
LSNSILNFQYSKKIARIRSQDYLNPKFTRVYNKENLPIDVIISPEIEIAKSIQRKLEAPGALDSVPFSKNNIRLLEILIKDNCKLIGHKLNELTNKFPQLDANIVAIIRKIKPSFQKKLIKLNLMTRFMLLLILLKWPKLLMHLGMRKNFKKIVNYWWW